MPSLWYKSFVSQMHSFPIKITIPISSPIAFYCNSLSLHMVHSSLNHPLSLRFPPNIAHSGLYHYTYPVLLHFSDVPLFASVCYSSSSLSLPSAIFNSGLSPLCLPLSRQQPLSSVSLVSPISSVSPSFLFSLLCDYHFPLTIFPIASPASLLPSTGTTPYYLL